MTKLFDIRHDGHGGEHYVPCQRRSRTSTAAAESVKSHLGRCQREVLEFIEDCGVEGATTDEVIRHFVLRGWSENTPRARMWELEPQGRIFKKLGADGKPMTRPTRTGCPAVIYIAAPTEEFIKAQAMGATP